MKTKLLIIMIILIFVTVAYAADKKWSIITENTTVADADEMLLIDIGTGDSQKITVLNLFDTINTSAELIAILGDETGTGALVFAISPTLVTPALGVIASGVGTTLTALNGENIQDDTIDDDSIDWADCTFADFDFETAWKMWHSDAAGDVTEITLGINGTFLESNGAAAAPAFRAIADGDVPDNITIDLATLATTVTVSDDEATNDNQEIVFTTDNANLESDGDFHYNPSTGTVTATEFVGGGAGLTAIDGENITDDTIDNDSIDWVDMTDLTTDGALDADVVEEDHIADNGIDSEHYNDGSIDLVHIAAAAYAVDLVTTAPVTGATDNIMVGADADVTIALDFTAAWNFGGAAGSEWVNDGAPTTDAAGEIALDTTIVDHQPLWQYYDGGENMTIIAIDTAQLPALDNEIIGYDAATDKWILEAPGANHNVASHSDTSATGTELDTLTDNSISDTLHRHTELVASDGTPDPALSVDSVGRVGMGTSAPDGSLEIRTGNSVIRIRDTGDTATATTSFVEFGGTTAANWDRTGYVGDTSSGDTHIRLCAEDSDLILGDSSGVSVLTLSGGDVTVTGALEGATLTEGGNAVPNATDHLGFFGGTTSLQLLTEISNETGTGALVFATSPTLVTPTLGTINSGVGTALTALNGENIQNDTIDNDSIDWGDMTDLDTDGAVIWGNIAEGELTNASVVDADIKDDVIQEPALNITNAGAAGVDNYLLSYNHAGTNFTWVLAGAGDLLADATVPMTANWDIGNFDITLKSLTGDGTIEGATLTEGGNAVINAVEGGTFTGNIIANANLSVGNAATTAGVLTLLEDDDDGAHFASFMVPALDASTVYTLPPDDGDNTEVLQTDGAGTLTWVANAGSVTAWDDIGDPDAAATVDFVTYTQTIDIGVTDDGGPKSGLILDVTGLGAGITDVIALEITTATNDDTDYIPFAIYDDSGGDNDRLFMIDSEGVINFESLGRILGLTNNIYFQDNSDGFIMSFAGTDCDLRWTDGVLNLRNFEDGVDAIVEIEGKDAGEKGILRVLSDGDDKHLELHHDDTDGHIITNTGDIHIEPAGGDTVFTGGADFGGADLELPQASPGVPDADGEVELDFTDGKMVIQHGAAHAELGGATDIVMGTLIKCWGGTIYEPDGVNDVMTVKAINSIEFPHGVVITAVYLGISSDTNYVLTVQNFDDFDTINAGNGTIDTVTYTADTTGEIIDTTPTYATIAAGQLIMISIPATDVDWIHFEIYYYEPAA